MLVRDLMSTAVRTFHPSMPLREAASALVANGISGAPVCTADGQVVGVLSASDILFKEVGVGVEHGKLLSRLAAVTTDDGSSAKQSARTVGEAMTSPAIIVRPSAAVAVAARTMTECNVNRLPVVLDGRLVGIIARSDLVRAFSRSDDEICADLDEVVQRELWIPREYVAVTVTEGHVRVTGTVDTRTDAELVAAFASRVPGVVEVQCELDWREDDLQRRLRVPVLPSAL